jgi:hypothetical protein
MAELQTHPPGVALPTFRTQVPWRTRPVADGNAPRTYDYQTVPLDVSIPTNMEHQAQHQIDRILDSIHSLDDLSADDVIELRRISERSLVLDKFKVSPAEYQNWVDKVGGANRGVEYDAQNACLVLKERPGWMHEAASQLISSRLLRELEDRLSAATGSRYFLTGSTGMLIDLSPYMSWFINLTIFLDCSLEGKDGISVKQADASLMGGAEWPAVVLEVGVSETTNKLYEDARRWLEGSEGNTKLVILVDIQENNRQTISKDNLGLSAAEFQQRRHPELSRHILQWYRSREIRLFGSFHLSVHLWYSDHDEQCILNKAAFSQDNKINLTTVQDIPLRLEHLMPAGSRLDVTQPLLFPLRRLVDTLQNGFEHVEIQRASDLAQNAQKKYKK